MQLIHGPSLPGHRSARGRFSQQENRAMSAAPQAVAGNGQSAGRM
jgi:hypothetical protein